MTYRLHRRGFAQDFTYIARYFTMSCTAVVVAGHFDLSLKTDHPGDVLTSFDTAEELMRWVLKVYG